MSALGAYIDLDPGMHRSGMPIEDHASIRALAGAIRERGIELRGLHEYDGHLGGEPDGPREAASRMAFERLLAVTAALEGDGHRIAELVVGGSHTSEASLVELAAGRTTAVSGSARGPSSMATSQACLGYPSANRSLRSRSLRRW